MFFCAIDGLSWPQSYLGKREQSIWMIPALGPLAPQWRTSLAEAYCETYSRPDHQETDKDSWFYRKKKFMAVSLPPVWLQNLGWCSLTDSYKPAAINNVHLQETQSPVPQPGGLLLSSLLILLSVTLLCSPLIHILSWQQWQRRRDRDGSDTSCRAGTGFTGEEWGAGGLSGAEGEGVGGNDKAAVNSVSCDYANILTLLRNIESETKEALNIFTMNKQMTFE